MYAKILESDSPLDVVSISEKDIEHCRTYCSRSELNDSLGWAIDDLSSQSHSSSMSEVLYKLPDSDFCQNDTS